jgi:hypothetical protein
MVPKQAQAKKGNKQKGGGKVKVRQTFVPGPILQKPVAPILQFPTPVSRSGVDLRKWCIENKVQVINSNDPEPAFELNQGNVVIVTQQNVQVPGHDAAWAHILYEGKSGWVEEIYLDDYVEDFPKDEVKILNPTPEITDAAQYMKLNGETLFNMCGELCVAYIVKNDLNPLSSIEAVLENWKNFKIKGSFSYSQKTIREGTTANHLKDIFQAYGYTNPGDIFDLTSAEKEHSLDRASMQAMLGSHYLVARVKCNLGLRAAGELVSINQGSGRDERNHWVVVNQITHNGNRVEIYNPFPNKREAYSFNEFFYACTAPKLSGIWVRRKQKAVQRIGGAQLEPRKPKPEVQTFAHTPETTDAAQYLMIGGGRKTNLCGEFSVAYILNKSMNASLNYWRQEDQSRIRDLLTMLKAYGYYEKDRRAFSIESVLNYWKETQPKLYDYHVGSNQPTGTGELISILRAYGFTNTDINHIPIDYIGFRKGLTDQRTGRYLPSPGRMKKMLETHFLIAGVGIDGKTGRLIRGPKGVRHWVVVEKITPVGKHYVMRHFGGNGGWVSLYNPFTNVMEEYSYRELSDSMSETGLWDGLWVKRRVEPKFEPAQVLSPMIEIKAGKGARKQKPTKPRVKWPIKRVLEEIQKRLKNNRPAEQIPALIAGAGSGWSKEEIRRLVPMPKEDNTGEPDIIEQHVRDHLDVETLPSAVASLLRAKSQGDPSRARMLADVLHDMGILIIGPGKQCRLRNFPLQPELRQAAIERFVAGLSSSQKIVPRRAIGLTSEQPAPDIAVALTSRVADTIRPILALQVIKELEQIQSEAAKKKQ